MLRNAVRALIVLAALAMPALAAEPPAAVRVPAAFRGNDVYLRVRLDGGAPVWMRFDVGVSESSLAPAFAGGNSGSAARMTVRVGALTVPGVLFHLAKPPAGRAPDGGALAGRLGQDWLGTRMVELRYREHEVWMSEPVVPDPTTVAAR